MASRKLQHLIFLALIGNCLAIAICGLAMGTKNWFKADLTQAGDLISTTVNYGLFEGTKTSSSTIDRSYKLYVVCAESKDCMYSCSLTPEGRKRDINNLRNQRYEYFDNECDQFLDGLRNENVFTDDGQDSDEGGNTNPLEIRFMSFILWLVTIIFLIISMVFSFIAGAQSLYNTFWSPYQPIFSVFGLYIWNGIAIALKVITMIIWGVNFAVNLNKNAAISDTLNPTIIWEVKGKLDYSYWILFVAIFAEFCSIAIILYRSWTIKKIESGNKKVMTENVAKGETLLF